MGFVSQHCHELLLEWADTLRASADAAIKEAAEAASAAIDPLAFLGDSPEASIAASGHKHRAKVSRKLRSSKAGLPSAKRCKTL